jgi:phosphopantetheinyl transferase
MNYKLTTQHCIGVKIYLAELLMPPFEHTLHLTSLSDEELMMLNDRKTVHKKSEFIFSRILIKKHAGIAEDQHHLFTVKYCAAWKCTGIFQQQKLIQKLSLSHSNQYVAFAFYNSEFPVALDIETTKIRQVSSIVKAYFCQQDQEFILNNHSPLNAFYTLWTKKEAVAKLTNTSVLSLLKTSNQILEKTYHTEHLINDKYILSVCALSY